MRYVVTKQIIDILGTIWMPATEAAMHKELTPYDMKNIGDPTNRKDVELWLIKNSGDFSKILDFRADFTIDGKDIVHEWSKWGSDDTFNECMYGGIDDEDDELYDNDGNLKTGI